MSQIRTRKVLILDSSGNNPVIAERDYEGSSNEFIGLENLDNVGEVNLALENPNKDTSAVLTPHLENLFNVEDTKSIKLRRKMRHKRTEPSGTK